MQKYANLVFFFQMHANHLKVGKRILKQPKKCNYMKKYQESIEKIPGKQLNQPLKYLEYTCKIPRLYYTVLEKYLESTGKPEKYKSSTRKVPG